MTGYFGEDSVEVGALGVPNTDTMTGEMPFYIIDSVDTSAKNLPKYWDGTFGIGLPNSDPKKGPTDTLIQRQKSQNMIPNANVQIVFAEYVQNSQLIIG